MTIRRESCRQGSRPTAGLCPILGVLRDLPHNFSPAIPASGGARTKGKVVMVGISIPQTRKVPNPAAFSDESQDIDLFIRQATNQRSRASPRGSTSPNLATRDQRCSIARAASSGWCGARRRTASAES